MAYNFEKIGKQSVLNQLVKDIKGKADFLQATNINKNNKLGILKDIEKLAKDAHKILSEL